MTEMRDAIFYKAYKALATDLKTFFDHEGRDVLKEILTHGLLGLIGARSTDPSSRVRFLGEYLGSLPLRSGRENRANMMAMIEEMRYRFWMSGGVDEEFNHLYVERPGLLGIGPVSDQNMGTVPFKPNNYVRLVDT